MPSEKTTGILFVGALLVLAFVVLARGFATSISQFLAGLGMPASLAADFGSVVFFGVLVGLAVLVIKAVPRLSRV